MGNVYIPPKVTIDMYGRHMVTFKSSVEFNYLIGMVVSDIVLFDESTEDIFESGKIILPRYYSIFVGTKDGDIQLKPYEHNPHRIVVSTYKDVIISIDSIG